MSEKDNIKMIKIIIKKDIEIKAHVDINTDLHNKLTISELKRRGIHDKMQILGWEIKNRLKELN